MNDASPARTWAAPALQEDPLLRVEGLRVSYEIGGRRVEALRGVDLELRPGEVLALVGESGSGKSTMAHALLGLLPEGARIDGGSIRFGGEEISRLSERRLRRLRGAEIGLVPQDPAISLNPAMRIGEQIAEALRIHGRADRRGAALEAVEILARVGISEPGMRARQYPHQLSGGMRQRVLIGVALACRPRLVVADEPTSALDATIQKKVLDYLFGLTRDSGAATLLITHDLAMAADRADRIAVMRHGELVEIGAVRRILEAPQRDYTRELIAAAPGLSGGGAGAGRISSPPAAARPAAPEAAAVPRFALQGLSKSFRAPGGGRVEAVREVSLSIPAGRTFGLVGESGSGKTTAARIAARHETADSGRVLLDGEEVGRATGAALRRFRRNVQYVHQNPFHSLDPRFRLDEIVTEPLRAFGIGSRREREARAEELLAQVALDPGLKRRRPGELSGGQRQRVAIARALALRPGVLILDEPISALDALVQDQILRLLDRLQREFGLTYLFISHDLAVMRRICDEVGVMQAGRLVEVGPAEQVFSDPRHPYARELIEAVPGRRWSRRAQG